LAATGINRIERVMTDNAWPHHRSCAYQRNVRHPRHACREGQLPCEVSADGHDEIDAALGREAADLAEPG
jgi:hypothetical protein